MATANFNAEPLPERFITINYCTFVLQLSADDVPEDWVCVRRLGNTQCLGDGRVGLVPKGLLSPVPGHLLGEFFDVLQQVSKQQRLATPTHLEGIREESESEDEEENEEVQQPAVWISLHAELPGGHGTEANTIMHASSSQADAAPVSMTEAVILSAAPLISTQLQIHSTTSPPIRAGTRSGDDPLPRANPQAAPVALSSLPSFVVRPYEGIPVRGLSIPCAEDAPVAPAQTAPNGFSNVANEAATMEATEASNSACDAAGAAAVAAAASIDAAMVGDAEAVERSPANDRVRDYEF